MVSAGKVRATDRLDQSLKSAADQRGHPGDAHEHQDGYSCPGLVVTACAWIG